MRPFGIPGVNDRELDQPWIATQLLMFLAAICFQIPDTMEHPREPATPERDLASALDKIHAAVMASSVWSGQGSTH